MKLRITNTWKHAVVGALVGLAGAGLQWLVNLIPNTQFYVGWFIVAAMTFFAIRYEVWQEGQSPLSTREYLELKWLDTIVDVLAAVIACALVLWMLGAL